MERRTAVDGASVESRLLAAQEEAARLRREYAVLLASRSWRLTAALRWVVKAAGR